MLLYQWQGVERNFGDALNPILWSRLLPGYFDQDPRELFLGIGSVLDARHPQAAIKVVAGAGYGGYEPPPVLDDNWMIHWVRGPRSARRLGLPEHFGLGDPAMLLPDAGLGTAAGGEGFGFMPHFESLARGAWQEVAAAAGLRLIDPRDEPTAVIGAIGRCRVLLSEAMHGVIVADTLRVPWIALEPLVALHRAKWHDWADTVGLQIAFRRLAPSSLLEQLYASRLTDHHRGRTLLQAHGEAVRRVAHNRFVAQAVETLRRASAATPQLSDATALDRCRARMLARLDEVRRRVPSRD